MTLISRRRFLELVLGLPVLAACTRRAPEADGQILPTTPACGDGDDATPPQTEGPFFKPASPERTSLVESETVGTPLIVAGSVLGTDCRPIAGALLDFWQADDAGVYDNEGFALRGHQFADDQGRWELGTVVPGLYPGRTRHIHVNVQAPNVPVLTTQLYFPAESANELDGIFDPALLMDVRETADGQRGGFTFVLDAS